MHRVLSEVERPCFVTEIICYGTLLEFLHGEGRKLPPPSLIRSAAQIASGMRYLELEGCIHLDLAARRIVVGENFVCKVAGIFHVRKLEGEEYFLRRGDLIPIRWTAPEVARYGRFTIKSDVWSFGVLLTELFSKGKLPYRGIVNENILTSIEEGYRLSCPTDCPRSLYDLMLKCWRINPVERPTFETLQGALDDYFAVKEQGWALTVAFFDPYFICCLDSSARSDCRHTFFINDGNADSSEQVSLMAFSDSRRRHL